MGTLNLPRSGLVYVDANPIIYTVEKHPDFGPLPGKGGDVTAPQAQ